MSWFLTSGLRRKRGTEIPLGELVNLFHLLKFIWFIAVILSESLRLGGSSSSEAKLASLDKALS